MCGVLDLYWEIIPSATTAAFVAKLTGALGGGAVHPVERAARRSVRVGVHVRVLVPARV